MRNTWLETELKKISEDKYHEIIQRTIDYICQLEDDNESLQISMEASIWSPNRWNENAPTLSDTPKK